MPRSRSGAMGYRKSVCRPRRVRGTGLMVWTLMGMGLLAWSTPSAGQPSYQQRSAQGQVPLLSAWPASPPPVQPGQATVTVDGNKLSVALQEVGLREVMEAIARQAGMRVSFIGAVGQATLTASFAGLPLEDGLRRLLRGMDYAFVYVGTGAARRISQVFVMSGSATQPQGVAAATADESAVAVAAVLREAIDRQGVAEGMQTAIIAAGGTVQEYESPEEGVAPQLNAAFQRVLSGQDGAAELLRDQLRQATDQFQQLIEQGGQ